MIKYADFVIDDIFEKIKTKPLKYKASDLRNKHSDIYNLPALTAGVENQGLAYFVPRDESTVLKNVISVSANGANTGVMYYQPHEFTVLQDSYAIRLKDREATSHEYLYLVAALQKTIRHNYDWSNKAGWERIKSEKITLPVTDSGRIDFPYMENRIRKLEGEHIRKLEAYLKTTGLSDYTLTTAEKAVLAEFRERERERERVS